MTKSRAVANLDNVAGRYDWHSPPYRRPMDQNSTTLAAVKDCHVAGVESWKVSAVLRDCFVPKSQFGI